MSINSIVAQCIGRSKRLEMCNYKPALTLLLHVLLRITSHIIIATLWSSCVLSVMVVCIISMCRYIIFKDHITLADCIYHTCTVRVQACLSTLYSGDGMSDGMSVGMSVEKSVGMSVGMSVGRVLG